MGRTAQRNQIWRMGGKELLIFSVFYFPFINWEIQNSWEFIIHGEIVSHTKNSEFINDIIIDIG